MGFRALKKTLEALYTTKVNNRVRTSRGTTLPNQPRAAQHQLEHIHMLLECGRLCNDAAARTAEICRSEPSLVPPSRADAPSTSNTGVSTSPHTRQRSERTNDIANAPFWEKNQSVYLGEWEVCFATYDF